MRAEGALNNGPYSQQGRLSWGPVRSPGASPAVCFTILSSAATSAQPGALILPRKPIPSTEATCSAQASSDSCGPWLGPTDVQCSLSRALGYSCQGSPLPLRVSFSWCHSFLALSVMPIPCTLDERIQGQRT